MAVDEEIEKRLAALEAKTAKASSHYPDAPAGTRWVPALPTVVQALVILASFAVGVTAGKSYFLMTKPAKGSWTQETLTSAYLMGFGLALLLIGLGIMCGEMVRLVKAEPAEQPRRKVGAEAKSEGVLGAVTETIRAVGDFVGALTPSRLVVAVGLVLILLNVYLVSGK